MAPDRVKFTGFVPKLEPFLNQNQIAILPFRMGGGVRFKALTAIWAGQAIVTTRLGIQGLGLISKKTCLIAKTAKNFADQILDLIKHPSQIYKLNQQAKLYLVTQHGQVQIKKNLLIYKKIINPAIQSPWHQEKLH